MARRDILHPQARGDALGHHRHPLPARRTSSDSGLPGTGSATRGHQRDRNRPDSNGGDARRRGHRSLPGMGRVRRHLYLRGGHRAANGSARPRRHGPRAHDGQLRGVHRGLHHRGGRWRSAAARHAGGGGGAIPDRPVRAPLAVPAGADTARLGNGDPADTGNGDAGHLRHHGRCAGRKPGGCRSAERSRDRPCRGRRSAEGDRGVASVGAGRRRRGGFGGCRSFRDL